MNKKIYDGLVGGEAAVREMEERKCIVVRDRGFQHVLW